MSEQTRIVTWEQMAVAQDAPAETYTVRRVTRRDDMVCPPPASTVTLPPADLDLQRLKDCKLPEGLQMEFKLKIPSAPEAFYITKKLKGFESYWAMYAIHADPLYGERGELEMPKDARKFLGRSPWATLMMVAHEVPAWCQSTYPNPATLHFSHLVSDATAFISTRSVMQIIDPILYGVVVAGSWWGFVPLVEWKI